MEYMKYLNKFNENGKTSIFNPNWVNILPKSLTIVTNNGTFTLKKRNDIKSNHLKHETSVINLMNAVQIHYDQNTVEDQANGDVLKDGEPDMLELDISFVKNNSGENANPNSLRLNIDMTYGDAMVYEFTIDKPNKIKVYHYTGKGSLHDPETFWGFNDESIKELCRFFNSFGFSLTPKELTFIDQYPDSYQYNNKLKENMTNNNEPYIICKFNAGSTKYPIYMKSDPIYNMKDIKRTTRLLAHTNRILTMTAGAFVEIEKHNFDKWEDLPIEW